jgi:dihydroorotase
MHDILIKGGRVVDPARDVDGKRDIGISSGKIVELGHHIPEIRSKKIIDAAGKIVTPGLIDIHTHVAHGVTDLGLSPEDAGVRSGMTTVCDAGSTGIENFAAFRDNVIANAATDIFAYLHVMPRGLEVMPENWDLAAVDKEAMVGTIADNREILKGVKIRATGPMVQRMGLEGIKAAKAVSDEAGVPLMVHLGANPEEPVSPQEMSDFTVRMLGLLDRGDILTHVFTWKKGGVIYPDGSVIPELTAAVERGVLLDVANARSHYSAEIAKIALDRGMLPCTLSTDITRTSFHELVFSLPVTMSKFLAIGYDLNDLIRMTTINPATILTGGKDRGSLGKGMPADITIFELRKGDYRFHDGVEGKTFWGDTLVVPELTLKSGVEIAAESRFNP